MCRPRPRDRSAGSGGSDRVGPGWLRGAAAGGATQLAHLGGAGLGGAEPGRWQRWPHHRFAVRQRRSHGVRRTGNCRTVSRGHRGGVAPKRRGKRGSHCPGGTGFAGGGRHGALQRRDAPSPPRAPRHGRTFAVRRYPFYACHGRYLYCQRAAHSLGQRHACGAVGQALAQPQQPGQCLVRPAFAR